jgi:hypothetical protein
MIKGRYSKAKFNEFDADNPEIYQYFEKFAKQVAAHRDYYSAKAIFHRVRWETMITGNDEYKINDGWISHYARKFMEKNPQHEGFFKTRVRKKSYHNVD